MRKQLLFLAASLWAVSLQAANPTVTVVFNGTTATVTIPADLTSYVSCSSGTSSHVKLLQASTTSNEIDYVLSGNSSDGEFYMEGSFKATIRLNGLTLTNPKGPAVNIQNGKRIKLNVLETNTLTDGANDTYNGCFHCKGHTEVTGKGTLNIVGNAKHGFYSKEYITFKNATLNITAAQKDGIHCKEYFYMEKGTINISGVKDDGIQVELDDEATKTGTTTDHEDENSGNFYMESGTLTIASYSGKAIKADGKISLSGTQNFDKNDILENAASSISSIMTDNLSGEEAIYDLQGRQLPKNATLPKGIYLIKNGKKAKKVMIR